MQRGPADMQHIVVNDVEVEDSPLERESLDGSGPSKAPSDLPLTETSVTTSTEKPALLSLVAIEEAEQSKKLPGTEGIEAGPQDGPGNTEVRSRTNPLVDGRLSNSSHDKPFACPHCNFSTSNRLALNRHQQRVHGGGYSQKRLRCSLCKYQTISSVAFAQHLRTTHSDAAGNKQLVCPCCDYQSDMTAAMLEHLSLHDNPQEKRHACPRCDFRASNKNELNEHVREKHIQSLTCPHCTYQSYSQQKLSRHIEIHDENKKKYVCPHCDYITKRKDCFCAHVFSHESSWAKFN